MKPTFMAEFNEEVFKNLCDFHEEELGPMPTDIGFAETLLQKSKAASFSYFGTSLMPVQSQYRILGSADTIKCMINGWFLTCVSSLDSYKLSLALSPIITRVTVLDHGCVTHQVRAIKNKIILEAYQDTRKHAEVPPKKITVEYQSASLRALLQELEANPPTTEGGAAAPP